MAEKMNVVLPFNRKISGTFENVISSGGNVNNFVNVVCLLFHLNLQPFKASKKISSTILMLLEKMRMIQVQEMALNVGELV